MGGGWFTSLRGAGIASIGIPRGTCSPWWVTFGCSRGYPSTCDSTITGSSKVWFMQARHYTSIYCITFPGRLSFSICGKGQVFFSPMLDGTVGAPLLRLGWLSCRSSFQWEYALGFNMGWEHLNPLYIYGWLEEEIANSKVDLIEYTFLNNTLTWAWIVCRWWK